MANGTYVAWTILDAARRRGRKVCPTIVRFAGEVSHITVSLWTISNAGRAQYGTQTIPWRMEDPEKSGIDDSCIVAMWSPAPTLLLRFRACTSYPEVHGSYGWRRALSDARKQQTLWRWCASRCNATALRSRRCVTPDSCGYRLKPRLLAKYPGPC